MYHIKFKLISTFYRIIFVVYNDFLKLKCSTVVSSLLAFAFNVANNMYMYIKIKYTNSYLLSTRDINKIRKIFDKD
jgi:hypothetical protein